MRAQDAAGNQPGKVVFGHPPCRRAASFRRAHDALVRMDDFEAVVDILRGAV